MTKTTNKFSERPIAVDFFSGAGGMSLGIEQAGFDVIVSVDRDGYHTTTHHRNFPYGKSLCSSITDLTPESIRSEIGVHREVDLVFGGPPCQGFSQMGIGDISDLRNTLVDEFARMIIGLKPRAFLMENVTGMLQKGKRRILDGFLLKMESQGYRITKPVRTLNAVNFGVPQKRERLFVIGIKSSEGEVIEYPQNTYSGLPSVCNVGEAFSGLPSIDQHEHLFKEDTVGYPELDKKRLSKYAKILMGYEKDPSDFSHPRKWEPTRCVGCNVVNHREDVRKLYQATRPGEMVPGHKLPRLKLDGTSPTLRAGSESEHGSHTSPRPVHPIEGRCITVREAARLHGYPDWFNFYPVKWHAYRQIGNSVCPPVARAIGTKIIRALGYQQRRPRKKLLLGDEYLLPANTLKQHTRITQLKEWPKVIEILVSQFINHRTGRLRKKYIAVEDIQNAINNSGAKMPRNPASRFIQDLSRSRNVVALLKPLLDLGYTIQLINKDEKQYGKIVPASTQGTIEKKDAIIISAKEFHNTSPIPKSSWPSPSKKSFLRFIETRYAKKALFSNVALRVQYDTDLFNEITSNLAQVEYQQNGLKRSGVAVVAKKTRLPSISDLLGIVEDRGYDFYILLIGLTSDLFAIIKYDKIDKLLQETDRIYFSKKA